MKQRCDGWRAVLAVASVFVGMGACASGEAPGVQVQAWAGHSLERPALDEPPLGTPASAPQPDAAPPTGSTETAGNAGAGPASDAGQPPAKDCCTASDSGGCEDTAIEACVCEGDAFCCTVEYDALCARQATSRCGLDCDARPPASDCCSPSDVPGCTEPAVEACICDIDPFCCTFRFDPSCVNLAVARCSAACGADGVQP